MYKNKCIIKLVKSIQKFPDSFCDQNQKTIAHNFKNYSEILKKIVFKLN